jgi:DNA-binding MarR family transcriptional regulator
MTTKSPGLREPDYQNLAQFRHLLRRFVVFSEGAAREAGLQPQQHQLLLAVKGLPPDGLPTIGALAWQLQLKHHTVVGLADRLCDHGFLARKESPTDGRKVHLVITRRGEALLRRLSLIHRKELQSAAPQLLQTLKKLVHEKNVKKERP